MEMEKCRMRLQIKGRGRLPSPTVPALVSSVSCLQTSPGKPGPEISWSRDARLQVSLLVPGLCGHSIRSEPGTPPPQHPRSPRRDVSLPGNPLLPPIAHHSFR